MTEKQKRTEISDLGEFGLIDRIRDGVKLINQTSLKGIGDDAAVISSDPDHLILMSSDILTEGIHFDLGYMPLAHLGYKAAVVNISDIAAMNGIPKQILVSLALSNRMSVEAVDAIYEGIGLACKNYKVDLVGGDTTASASGLFLSLAVSGQVDKSNVCYRNGARDKDIICVTGDLGGAFMGLQVLEREKQAFLGNPEMQPKLEGYEYIVERQLKPEARMDIIHELRDLGIVPTAMIDVSDGLASDLMHICRQSGLGGRLFEDKLPIDAMTFNTAVEFKLDPITCALNGGEDYELLFTIAPGDFEKVEKHADIHFVGHMDESEKSPVLITKQQNVVPLQAQGWKHFSA